MLFLATSSLAAADAAANPDQPVTIRGQILDDKDRPVADATVGATAPAMGPILGLANSELLRARSGADGRFELTLPASDVLYSLYAQRMGYDGPVVTFIAGPVIAKTPIKTRLTHHAPGKKLYGRVIDPDVKPVPDLPLTLVGEYGFSLKTTTGKDGTFQFDGVPDYIGQAVVVAHRKGQAIPQQIVRTPDLGPKGLELTLMPAGRFEGVAVDVDGKPISDAQVLIRPWFSSGFSLTAKCDSKGRWAIDDVPSGEYLIEPSAPKHFVKPPRGVSHDRERVAIAAGETVKQLIEMQRSAIVRGQVRDPDGKPVAGAVVGMPCTWDGDYRNQVRSVRTDARGNFEIATGHVDVEGLHVAAFSAQFGLTNMPITPLSIGDVREGLALSLPGAVRVRGTLVNERGEPIAGVICAAGAHEVSATTGADGRFDLGRISTQRGPDPVLTLRAPRPGGLRWIVSMYDSKVMPDAQAYYEDSQLAYDGTPGKTLDLKATLKPTDLLAIKGRVVNAKGEPAPEARVYLFAGNAGDDTWSDLVLPKSLGGSRFQVTDKPLTDDTADKEGRFHLRAVRFDGKATKEGTRFSIGVVVDRRAAKLVKDITLPEGEKEREVEIEVDDTPVVEEDKAPPLGGD